MKIIKCLRQKFQLAQLAPKYLLQKQSYLRKPSLDIDQERQSNWKFACQHPVKCKQIKISRRGEIFILHAYIFLSGKIRSRKFSANLRGSPTKSSLQFYFKQNERKNLKIVFLNVICLGLHSFERCAYFTLS